MLHNLYYYHYFECILKGTSINGNEESLSISSAVNTAVTKMIKSIENGLSDEPIAMFAGIPEVETVVTTFTEEIVTETITAPIESESSTTTIADESAPAEALTAPLTNGTDTSQ
jgi:hypothetical protein